MKHHLAFMAGLLLACAVERAGRAETPGWTPDPGGTSVDFSKTVPVEKPDEVFVRLHPLGFIDNLFCLTPGDPGTARFVFHNRSGRPIRQPRFFLELPAGFELLDVREPARLVGRTPGAGAREARMRYDVDIWGSTPSARPRAS